MNSYTDLTREGKIRRLRRLAIDALCNYYPTVISVTYHCFDTNLLYRVTADNGSRYILRLATPGWRTYTDLVSEAMWLDALATDTDIHVPRIVKTMGGVSVLQMTREGIPDIWNATLMTYLPGRLLGGRIGRRNIEKMGKLFAHMHVHGKEWKPPHGFTTRVFDHFVSRNEPEALLEKDAITAYTHKQHRQIKRLYDVVADTYRNLDRDDLRVIHCDLWHDNIKVHRGELCPFDFEDTVWGFRLHDIAMAMLDLLEDTSDEAYPGLLNAFKQGYESILDWPEGNMEALQIGRLLWKINWVCRFGRRSLAEMVARHEPIFTCYERTGTLKIGCH